MYKKICVFGASITEGFYDTEAGGWVDRIKQYLKFKNAISVYNLGISGNDTSKLLKRFDIEVEARRPDEIIFALGNNDSSYLVKVKHNNTLIEIFEKNIETLIKKSKAITKDVSYVGLTPVDEEVVNPWKGLEERFFYNKSLEQYNSKIMEVCLRQDIKYIDLWNEFINQDYKKLLHDGLHPNSNGHKLIFEIVKEKLKL